MENSQSTLNFIGELPDLPENAEIVFEDEIRVNSLVFFDRKDDNTTAVRLVDLDDLEGFTESVFRVRKGGEAGQIVFERIEIGALKEMLARENRLDELLALTFENLGFFYRDHNLSDDFIDKYYPGLILQERGFTDASYLRGGLAAKHRFLIASSQAKDLSRMPGANPEHGLVVILSGSFFKVLDVAEMENRRQITLLHIPEELVAFFSAAEMTDMENQIIAAARADFEENFAAAPVGALLQDEWRERVLSPVGIADDGEYFYSQRGSSEDGDA